MRKPKATQCVTDPMCPKKVHARDMCIDHYMAWRREHPELINRYGPRDESLRSKLDRNIEVNLENGCWDKIGWTTGFGYGQIWWHGKFEYMHLQRYELDVAPIPDGFVVDHLCERKQCSNPYHLEHVPHRINTLRGEGHPANDGMLRTGCVCSVREAESCPLHGQLHWRPDWRECLTDVANKTVRYPVSEVAA